MDNQRQGFRSRKGRLLVWLMAGSLGAGVIAVTPAPTFAIDETKAIPDDKVPQAVMTTARANYLDATNVQFRLQEEGKNLYQVNYTIPGNVRLQMILTEEGAVSAGPRLAPNQPENAPGQKQQERALAEWQARVVQVAEAWAREQNRPPAQPAPAPGQPPLAQPPLAQPPAQPEVRVEELPASALPAPVARSFQRFSPNATQVNYYRVSTDPEATYKMLYTTAGGEKREVTVNAAGQEIQSGLVGGNEGVRDTLVPWDQIPEPTQKTLIRITGRDPNAKYYRQVRPEGISYGAMYTANGREMWTRIGENGDPIVDPVSAKTGRPIGDEAEAEQASAKLSAAERRDRVNFVDLPGAVQDRVLKVTEGAKEVVNMTHRDKSRTVYHTYWVDRDGKRHEAWFDASGRETQPLKLN